MVYVTSDIRGDIEAFKNLLIRLKHIPYRYPIGDLFIIAGNWIGDGGAEVLDYFLPMLECKEVVLLKGRQEYQVQRALAKSISDKEWNDKEEVSSINGQIQKMSIGERIILLDTLENLPYYYNIRDLTVCAGGLECDNYAYTSSEKINVEKSIEKAVNRNEENILAYYSSKDLIIIPHLDLSQMDTHIIAGHIDMDEVSDTLIQTNWYTILNTGSHIRFACYCLDHNSVYYEPYTGWVV